MKKALLIVDCQNFYVDKYPKLKRIISKVKKIADEMRGKALIVHALTVYDSKKELPRKDIQNQRFSCIKGSQDAEEVSEVYDKRDKYVIKKHYSAFFNTNLDKILKKNKVKKIYITGLLTHCCVYATAIDAYQLGYDIVFVKDAIASYRQNLHKELFKFFSKSVGEVVSSRKFV